MSGTGTLSNAGWPRAVVLVGGSAAPYSRSLRIARALATEGYSVEIAAVAAAGLPVREPVAAAAPGSVGEPPLSAGSGGAIELRRYAPTGRWRWLGASDAARGATASGPEATVSRPDLRRLIGVATRPLLALRRWLLWPHAVRGWWATLARDLTPADLYHACGSLTIAPALAARRRTPVGPAGRPARVIYDAVDDVAESNEALAMPGPVRRRIAATEAGWARAADAVVTVNDALAERLGERWGLADRPLALPNAPEPPDPALVAGAGDHLRVAAGLPETTRIVLFQGRLGPGLGLEAAAEAILRVPDTALVLLGFGRGLAASRARDREPRFAGRHVSLAARHPDELLAWTASADAAVIPLPPRSVNQRLSTPNKFWEALAVGTPVVVVRGLEVMERIVREHDLGAIADSAAPADLAVAIGEVLDRTAREGPAWRERIAAIARERFGWPAAAAAYRALVREVAS